MKFGFDVGVHERHRVEFSWDQMWGRLAIGVDGDIVLTDRLIFSSERVMRYGIVVGIDERHKVAIEKKTKALFAGFRKGKYRVFVDDQLIQEHEGVLTKRCS